MDDIKSKIRNVPDFPKPGINFKDITPLLADAQAFKTVIECLAHRYRGKSLDLIVGIESRGFIFATALAYALGVGFIPVRKKGKLPFKTLSVEYALEYGTDHVEIHADAIATGKRILVMDDLLATGGTAKAACDLIEKTGGRVVECAFVIELGFLNGRDRLKGREIFSLVQY